MFNVITNNIRGLKHYRTHQVDTESAFSILAEFCSLISAAYTAFTLNKLLGILVRFFSFLIDVLAD